MNGAQLLDTIDQATVAVQTAIAAVRARGDAAGLASAQSLLVNLSDFETYAQRDMSRICNLPLPAPDPAAAGGWTQAVRRNGRYMGLAKDVRAPDWAMDRANRIIAAAGELHAWAVGQQQPEPQVAQFAGAGSVVAAVAPSASIFTPRFIGGVATVATLCTGIISTYLNHKAESRHDHPFEDNEGPKKKSKHNPEEVRDAAQQVLDQEMPGAVAALKQSPDGDWIANVRKGAAVIARRRGKTAAEAAGDAVRAAVDTTIKASGEVIDAEFVDITPHTAAAAAPAASESP